MFLLDTDVVFLRCRPKHHPVAFQRLESQRQADLHLSVAMLAELARGIVHQRRCNPEFARDLTIWLEQTIMWFDDRVIPVNAATADVGANSPKRWATVTSIFSSWPLLSSMTSR